MTALYALVWFILSFPIGAAALVVSAALYFRVLTPRFDALAPFSDARKALATCPVWIPILIAALICWAIDVVFNIVHGTWMFAQLPFRDNGYHGRQITFSDRLQYQVKQSGWRSNLAKPIARFVNWIEPNHIHF